MLGRLLKVLLALVLLLAAATAGGWWKLRTWAAQPLLLNGERIVELPSGTSLLALAQTLEDGSVVTNAVMFYGYVRLLGSYKSFQAGKYRFTGSVAPRDVKRVITAGETFDPVVLSVTIPEGFQMRQVLERLAANGVGHLVELKRLSLDEAFLKRVGVATRSLEGFLYPATYNFSVMPTAEKALEVMVKAFWEKLPKDYEKRVNERGLTLAQAVAFASMIETETQVDEEKSLISEVIWRRLKDDVPLAIDATLIYGIVDYDGDLKWSHLSDASNPYNTRIHKGLPPTAIGAPGVKSMEAVLTPSNRGYYYYVLIPDGGVRHHFSKTLREHNEHVRKLVKASKLRKKR